MDPLAHEYLYLTPYNFTENNPVNLIDPNGLNATCPNCPDGEEFDFYRNSVEEYTYDPGTKEVTMVDEKNTIVVMDHPTKIEE